MELKPYQAEALDTLRRFLEDARIAGPAASYKKLAAHAVAKAAPRVT